MVVNAFGQVRDHGVVGELADVVHRQRRFGVVIGRDARSEHLRGELVAAGMVGLELVWRHRDLLVASLGLEDGLGQRDVFADPLEEVFLLLDAVAVGVFPEVPRRQDVVVGVTGQSLLHRLAFRPLDGERQLVRAEVTPTHTTPCCSVLVLDSSLRSGTSDLSSLLKIAYTSVAHNTFVGRFLRSRNISFRW